MVLSTTITSRLTQRMASVHHRRGSAGAADARPVGAGSVPERRAGSVPERRAGSVPERRAGFLVATAVMGGLRGAGMLWYVVITSLLITKL
jgi:hypothetical protein